MVQFLRTELLYKIVQNRVLQFIRKKLLCPSRENCSFSCASLKVICFSEKNNKNIKKITETSAFQKYKKIKTSILHNYKYCEAFFVQNRMNLLPYLSEKHLTNYNILFSFKNQMTVQRSRDAPDLYIKKYMPIRLVVLEIIEFSVQTLRILYSL